MSPTSMPLKYSSILAILLNQIYAISSENQKDKGKYLDTEKAISYHLTLNQNV